MYLWSPVSGTVMEQLGNVTLLEEVCFYGQVLTFQPTCAIPRSLSLLLVDQNASSQLFLLPCAYFAIIDPNLLKI